jgi:hypothetical protein
MSQSSSDRKPSEVPADAEQAWAEFCDMLKGASRVILADTAELDELDRSEGYRYLSRLARAGLEGCLEYADPRAPELLRLCHETIKMGADNPDNVYLSAPVHPDYRYRIYGTRGTVHYLGIGTYEGGYGAGGSFPPAGYVTLERSGAPVEIELASAPSGDGLFLPISARTRSVVVRQTFMDRKGETAAGLRIERTDGPHVPLPLTAAKLTRGLRGAGRFVQGCAELFANWTRGLARAPNQLPLFEPSVAAAAGGAEDITYYHGYWQLEPEQALVIALQPPVCDYWNFQLNNHFMESLDYRYHTISLNKHSAQAQPDGRVRLIIAARDPGFGNWIDTTGHRRGTMCLRWVRAETRPVPSTRVCTLAELELEHAAR